MRNFIVKSETFAFNGLYFRKAMPNSIEWTSFEMAAKTFNDNAMARDEMARCGVTLYVIVPAPKPRDEYVPSPSTGFVRQGRP